MAISGGGVLAAVVGHFFLRRRTNAEAESIEAETASKLLKGVTGELERMQAKQIVFESRVEKCEKAREESERRARSAERLAHESLLAEKELRANLATLQKAYMITRRRVEYLTEVVQQAGIKVSTWSTPPAGIEKQETK
jgi:predicted RNase H-like nuclease (RuvC/YqgF family)